MEARNSAPPPKAQSRPPSLPATDITSETARPDEPTAPQFTGLRASCRRLRESECNFANSPTYEWVIEDFEEGRSLGYPARGRAETPAQAKAEASWHLDRIQQERENPSMYEWHLIKEVPT